MDEIVIGETEFNFFKKALLFHNLSDEQIQEVIKCSKEEQYSPGEVIFNEGDTSTDLYLIIDGETSISKWDEEHHAQVPLGQIGQGQMLGEMSFLDKSPRSATVKTIIKTKTLKVSLKELLTIPEVLYTLSLNVTTNVLNNMRKSNITLAESLMKLKTSLIMEKSSGEFLLIAYFILGLSTLLCSIFFKENAFNLSWLLACPPIIALIRLYKFSWKTLGFNFSNWRWDCVLAFSFTLFALFVYGVLEYFFEKNEVGAQQPIWPLGSISQVKHWALSAIYSFSQEFIGRGILQSSLRDLLDEVGGYKTVLLNSCLLFILLIPAGLVAAEITFFISLAMGIIYKKEKSLLGVALLHFLLLGFFFITT